MFNLYDLRGSIVGVVFTLTVVSIGIFVFYKQNLSNPEEDAKNLLGKSNQ